ncbi:YkvA family protein [Glaciecola sp. SC05]|uniref:YkvA family protein n=1 Tax=Glaciecola sp. SC05 TaxID=1987355 RepID=UPI00352984AD
MTIQITFELSDEDLEHFRALMKVAIQNASKYSPAEVLQKARAVCSEMESANLPGFVKHRLDSLETLISALEDDEWQMPEDEKAEILTSLAYFSEPHDLVPDNIPGLGYVDDAIMIELVIQDMSQDLGAYTEFCQFRKTEENRRGNEADVNRESWLEGKRTEIRSNMRRKRRLFSR